MKTDIIIKDAKKAISDIIISYVRKIAAFLETQDKRLEFSSGEDVAVKVSDLKGRAFSVPSIRVDVTDSSLDTEDRIYENWPVQEIGIEDGVLYFIADFDPFNKEDVSITELQAIANYLEYQYGEM